MLRLFDRFAVFVVAILFAESFPEVEIDTVDDKGCTQNGCIELVATL